MTRAEQYALGSLIALAGVFWFFQMRMLTDGAMIVDQSSGALFRVYITTIALATISEIGIQAGLASLHRGKAATPDERDLAIQSRANQTERVFMIVAINVLVWQLLWEGMIPNHAMPRIDLTHAPTLMFILFAILFAGEAVKRISTLVLYRLQGGRA